MSGQSCGSSVVAEVHEQTHTPELPVHELARLTGQFSMSREEIVAVAMKAANISDSPFASPVLQLRRLLNL